MGKVRVLIACVLFLMSQHAKAQSREVKNEISQLSKEKGAFTAQAKSKSIDEARDKARKDLVKSIVSKFGIIDPIPSNLEDEVQFQSVRRQLASLGLNANEYSWERSSDTYVFLYVSDYNAKAYAAQRATIQFRNPLDYSFGEAFAVKEGDALAAARGNLITQFSAKITSESNLTTSEKTVELNQQGVTVSTTTELKTEENNGKYDEQFKSNNKVTEFDDKVSGTVFQEELEVKNRVYAQMTLLGLNSKIVNLGDEYYAFVYITKADKEKSFEVIKSKILASAIETERALNSGNITTGLKGLYKTYILSDTYYENVPYTFTDGSTTENLEASMRARIDAILKDEVQVVARPAYLVDEKDIVAPFQLLYKGKPLDGLSYQFKFQSYNFSSVLRNGRGRITLPNYKPEYASESFTLDFTIDLSDDLKADATIRELEPVKRLQISKNIQVNFKNVFKFNVEGVFYGKRVYFKLVQIDPSLVREVRWDLGNGEERYTSEPELSYTFDSSKQYEIAIEINAEPELGIKRYVDIPVKKIRVKEGDNGIVHSETERTEEDKSVSAIANMSVKKDNSSAMKITLNEDYKELTTIKSTRSLMTYLSAKKQQGVLNFGKQADILDSEGAFIVVADQEKIYERIIFSQNRFYKIDTGIEIASLADSYRGKYLIWIKKN